MAIPKGAHSYGMVTDYRVVNDTIESAATPKLNLEDKAFIFAGSTAWYKPDVLQGYLQVPLSEISQKMFTMVTTEGSFTPRRVLPGALNATGHF